MNLIATGSVVDLSSGRSHEESGFIGLVWWCRAGQAGERSEARRKIGSNCLSPGKKGFTSG